MKGKPKKIGLPPGTVVFTGTRKVEKVKIHYLEYDGDHFREESLHNQSTLSFSPPQEGRITWYDLRGLHDTALIESLGKAFSIHALILEDIVDPNQRAKFEEYEKGNFIILHALHLNPSDLDLQTEQVGLYFRPGLVITFQESDSDLFVHVRERLARRSGRIRERGAEYLVYALIDVLVDHYFTVTDMLEDQVETLEEAILDHPAAELKSRIHYLKKRVYLARKMIAPLREAINRFSKAENDWVDPRTQFFIRDLNDHILRLMEQLDSLRDHLGGLQDLYLSEISFKMNQIIQVLTIITTIFVPISFLAGLYGMNFEYMPELGYRNGYFILLGVMGLIILGLLWWFRRKKWL